MTDVDRMPTDSRLTCPTCGAVQERSVQCRRCRCDLSLMVSLLEHRDRLHARTLRHLRDGRLAEALRTARLRWSVSSDADAARLLGVCRLLQQDVATGRMPDRRQTDAGQPFSNSSQTPGAVAKPSRSPEESDVNSF
jgi:hypothetical protein